MVSTIQISSAMILLVFLAIVFATVQSSEEPRVCLENESCYMGSWFKGENGSRFANFQGIRYAQAPTQSLRFRRPVAFEPGMGTIKF